MKFLMIFNAGLAMILLFLFSSCGEKPDSIYMNGKIYTMDEKNSVVEAVAVSKGKIIDAGTNKDINGKYSSDNVIDLKGAVVLPGFIDSEGSIIELSKNLNYINLSYAKSIEEIKRLLLEKESKTHEGEWIGGYGWSELNIPEDELVQMDKNILDRIAPNYSVYLVNSSFNTVWVNSRLMRELRIDRNTPSPAGGEIEKDKDGEPTGVFYDSAVNLIKNNIPGLLRKDIITQVQKGVGEIIKYGITEVHDRTLGKEGIDIFRELIDSNRFPLKVYAIISGEDSSMLETYLNKGPETDYKDKLTIKAISLDYDGLFELQEASMSDKYRQEPVRNTPYVTEEIIEKIFGRCIDKNFQFCIKAVGDQAVTSSLNSIEKVVKQKSPKDLRTVIEYCEFVSAKDLSKISELKLIPSVRADVCMNDMQIVSQISGPESSKKIGLWNSLIKSAGMITSGSDFPFHQINPFVQIYYLTARQFADSVNVTIPNPDQKVTLLDAVKSYTVWPAYASFQENTKGTIEKGKFADMIVISNDIFSSDLKSLLETKVMMTIINGRIVYNNIPDPEKL